MYFGIIAAFWLPLLGTALGAACVFLHRGKLSQERQRDLSGFAAGVMTAAAVWSLLLPALDAASHLGPGAVMPVAIGLWVGVLLLFGVDRLLAHLTIRTPSSSASQMLVLAVTLHNLPEGMAVGAVFAGFFAGQGDVPAMGVLSVAAGIALQNIPEGAIIASPLHGSGMKRGRAFCRGVLSGVVEPVGAAVTLLATRFATALLPSLLSFGAGAMLYVVAEELLPTAVEEERPGRGALTFALGFFVMMVLDVVLGG